MSEAQGIQAKCDSVTKRLQSKEVAKGTFQDSAVYDFRFTLQASGQDVGNLTLHCPQADHFEVGKSYPLTI